MGALTELVHAASGLRLRKARALLLYLMQPVGRAHRTEWILDLLWRGADGKKANASFRQAIRHVRQSLGPESPFMVNTGGSTVSASGPADWSVESALTERLSQPDSFPEGAQLLHAYLQLLELSIGLSDSFDSWIEVTRVGLVTRVQDALVRHFAAPETALAAQAAELSLQLEPQFEAAARCLMKHHWSAKAANRAIDVYDRLYHHLGEAFDQEPETETIELLAAIKLSPAGGPSSAAVSERQRLQLRVKGADWNRTDPAAAGFETVLVADLRDRLACFREWEVLPDDSDAQEALTITLTLKSGEGTYTLDVTAVSRPKAQIIWNGQVTSPEAQWSDKVRGLIMQIANALQIVVADRHRSDMAASLYDQWLHALALKTSWKPADEDRAISTLEALTAQAPDFGPAHAELAGIYNIHHVVRPGTFQSEAQSEKALSHAFEALALDQRDTRAHRVLAWCHCHRGEFDLAEFHFEQSLVLNPQNPHTVASAALGFAFTENTPRAKDQISTVTRQFETMSPFHLVYLAASNYLTGDYKTAAEQCAAGAGLMSTVGGWHSAALAKLGETEAARLRLRDYCLEIATNWCGDGPCTAEAVISWFVSCFPLRHDSVREDLQHTLTALLPLPQTAVRSVAHIRDINPDGAVKR